MILSIHILSGGLAIVLGGVALSVKKGGTIHRRTGVMFVWSMIVMGFSASVLSVLRGAGATNAVAALLCLYYVGTAWTTVRPPSRITRAVNLTALTVATALALLAILGGMRLVGSPGLSPGGVPFRTIGVMSFVLAFFLLLSAAGDLRILWTGALRGGRRLARHLWRMCFALAIAAGSFFSIRERVARILPEPFTSGPMRTLPFLLLLGVLSYWLWRVLSNPRLPVRTSE